MSERSHPLFEDNSHLQIGEDLVLNTVSVLSLAVLDRNLREGKEIRVPSLGIILKEDTLLNIYSNSVTNNSISVGRLSITDIITPNEELKLLLKLIISCWIEFKEAFGLNIFSPRGATFGALHHNHIVEMDQDYADQKIFAQLKGKGKNLYHTEIDTTIGESDILSNGYFLKQLRLYLEGELNNFEDLSFIGNVLNIYEARKGNSSYTLQEVSDFFDLVKNRDMAKITKEGARLLQKRVIYF